MGIAVEPSLEENLKRWQEAGYTRKDVESQWNIENKNAPMTNIEKETFDKVFGPKPRSWLQKLLGIGK